MENRLSHFAIHVDDIERAKTFYSNLFNWGFSDYGQPDFLQITINNEPIGAIQNRKFNPTDQKILGLEGTIAVADIDATANEVEKNGGRIVMPKTEIPHVGWLIKFTDTEGNLLCAMQRQ